MKLGYFSPLPPAPTGVADYSAGLLPYLRRHGEIVVNQPGDRNLYHLGNNQLHAEIYARALREPGTIVVHDAVLHHFLLGTLTEFEYLDEFELNYGDRALAERLWQERSRSGSDPRYFAHPMLRRIVERSTGVIVHNPAAARIVLQHVPAARVAEIPHFFRASELPSRISLGIPADAVMIATFGHQRETKRPHVLLRAFHKALARGANCYLLFSGQFVSAAFEKSVAALLDHPRILRTGFLPEPDFWAHAQAADVVVNLRYPTASETSGIAIGLMGIGKPVVFTAGQEIVRFPETACLRVETGPTEESALAEVLIWLAQNPEARRTIGQHAAAHIREHHSPEKVAEAYWDAV